MRGHAEKNLALLPFDMHQVAWTITLLSATEIILLSQTGLKHYALQMVKGSKWQWQEYSNLAVLGRNVPFCTQQREGQLSYHLAESFVQILMSY